MTMAMMKIDAATMSDPKTKPGWFRDQKIPMPRMAATVIA